MVQLTAFIIRLAATDSDHLLDNDGFGSNVRVSCDKAARREREGATAAKLRSLLLHQRKPEAERLSGAPGCKEAAAEKQLAQTRSSSGKSAFQLTANTLEGLSVRDQVWKKLPTRTPAQQKGGGAGEAVWICLFTSFDYCTFTESDSILP